MPLNNHKENCHELFRTALPSRKRRGTGILGGYWFDTFAVNYFWSLFSVRKSFAIFFDSDFVLITTKEETSHEKRAR